MTSELPDLFRIERLSDYGVSHLSDNVLLLQYLQQGNASVQRALTVLKTRASGHEPGVRGFQITRDGIHLTDAAP